MRGCACGCGEPAGVYARSNTRSGQVKGQPRRFLPGHARYSGPLAWRRDKVPAGCPLTNRQFQVLSAAARGLTYKEIARDLGLGVSTVRTHVHQALVALGLTGCGSRPAVVLLKDRGWLDGRPTPVEPPPVAPDPRLTTVQLAYTWSFTRLVLERTVDCEVMVTLAFMLLCMDGGVRPARPRRTPDIDALLLRMARGCLRPI